MRFFHQFFLIPCTLLVSSVHVTNTRCVKSSVKFYMLQSCASVFVGVNKQNVRLLLLRNRPRFHLILSPLKTNFGNSFLNKSYVGLNLYLPD